LRGRGKILVRWKRQKTDTYLGKGKKENTEQITDAEKRENAQRGRVRESRCWLNLVRLFYGIYNLM